MVLYLLLLSQWVHCISQVSVTVETGYDLERGGAVYLPSDLFLLSLCTRDDQLYLKNDCVDQNHLAYTVSSKCSFRFCNQRWSKAVCLERLQLGCESRRRDVMLKNFYDFIKTQCVRKEKLIFPFIFTWICHYWLDLTFSPSCFLIFLIYAFYFSLRCHSYLVF